MQCPTKLALHTGSRASPNQAHTLVQYGTSCSASPVLALYTSPGLVLACAVCRAGLGHMLNELHMPDWLCTLAPLHEAGLWVQSRLQTSSVPLLWLVGPDEFETPALNS